MTRKAEIPLTAAEITALCELLAQAISDRSRKARLFRAILMKLDHAVPVKD
jgi:hypothetical protein